MGDPRTRRGRAGGTHPPADQEGHPEGVSGKLSAIETPDHERADCSGAGEEEGTKVSDILDTLGQHACLANDLAGFFRGTPKQTAFEAATTHLLETGIIYDGEEEDVDPARHLTEMIAGEHAGLTAGKTAAAPT